jgi:hypothetical protein
MAGAAGKYMGWGIAGFVPIANRWFMFPPKSAGIHSEAGSRPHYKIRFTGGLGVGSITELSGVWGSHKEIGNGRALFEFALAKEQQP